MMTEHVTPSATLMISACMTSASAWSRRPAPSARAMADEMPPPMAPAEIICISMTPGNTSAMPASASVPSFATNQVSIKPVAACATITSMLGHAIHSNVATIGPCSSARVRGVMAGAGTSSRAPTATGRLPSRVATLMRCSACARRVGLSPERAIPLRAHSAIRSMRIAGACARGRRARGQTHIRGL